MKLRDSENIWVLASFLGITGLLVALILAVVSKLTEEPIRQAGLRNELSMFKELNLPEFDSVNKTPFSVSGVEYTAALKDGKIVGYIAKSSTRSGYSGQMRALTGLDTDGKILAVQIVEHKETPGLGAAVCERKFQRTVFNLFKPRPSGLPPNAILDQFQGRAAGKNSSWKITKDGGNFAFRTGATVTSRAVVEMVNAAAVNFKTAREHFSKGVEK